MQGDPRVLDVLNQVLRKELTGISQYFLHARMCKNWGYAALAKRSYDESIDEMKHADRIIERILFLEGAPSLSEQDRIMVGRTVREQIDSDLGLEMSALAVLRAGIQVCLEARDHVTRELLEAILAEEEQHVDWLEAQRHLIAEVGEPQYLAQHIHERP